MKVPRLALGSVRRVGEDPACISSGRQAPPAPSQLVCAEQCSSARGERKGLPELKLDSVGCLADHVSYVTDVNELGAAGGSSSVEDSLPALVATETSNEFWDQMIPETTCSLELDSEAVSTGGTGPPRKSSGGASSTLGGDGDGPPGPVAGAAATADNADECSSSNDNSPRSAAAVMGCTTPELATVSAIKKSALTLFGADAERNSSAGVPLLLVLSELVYLKYENRT